jgi:hypothetical protein
VELTFCLNTNGVAEICSEEAVPLPDVPEVSTTSAIFYIDATPVF